MTKQNSPFSGLLNAFSSVRLAVVLLLMLAGTSILGTFIPQNKGTAEYVQAFGEGLTRLFLILDLTNMYTAWWFVLLMVLLTINVACCTVTRGRRTLTTAFGKAKRFNGFSSLPVMEKTTLAQSPKDVEVAVRGEVSRRFSDVEELSTDKGLTIQGVKGRWTRIGADVVHVGILVLMAGALMGSIFGFDGFMTIPEEETENVLTLRGTNERLELPFEIRCNTFSLSHYDSGAVKEYRSSLTIIENGEEVLTRDIIVNDPLTYRGITFYQASYGSLGAKDFSFSFTENATGKSVTKEMELGETASFGDGRSFTFKRFEGDYRFKGQSVGEAVIGTLTAPGTPPKEVVLLTRFTKFDKMRKGQWLLSVAGHGHAYYTGLQATKDPGVPLVYLGFVLVIAGCVIAFFIGPKKLRITIAHDEKGSSVTISGASPKSPWWIRNQSEDIVKKLEENS